MEVNLYETVIVYDPTEEIYTTTEDKHITQTPEDYAKTYARLCQAYTTTHDKSKGIVNDIHRNKKISLRHKRS